VRALVVAEFYPSRRDPVLGVWAHRQTLAARNAGAEVRVLVLHRLVPPRAAFAAGPTSVARGLAELVREPRAQVRDGIEVSYVPFISPDRRSSYAKWGAWGAPTLAAAIARMRRTFPFDVVHAHNAVPSGDAVRRAFALHAPRAPLVVSVHGGDVLYTSSRMRDGERAVARALGAARLVLANSDGIAELARSHGARETRVVHLGTDVPPARPQRRAGAPALVTVAHLVARKRHGDVLRALAVLGSRHPALRYEIVGDGAERAALEALATRLGVSERVDFRGQLAPERAIGRRANARCS
jgi:teichuronic acid biosynthesis glycosyltransferase TuaC